MRMNIPVGISDFEQIRSKGYYYIDNNITKTIKKSALLKNSLQCRFSFILCGLQGF